MYLCVRGYQAMIESGHVFVCYGVSSHDREWSCICVLWGIKPWQRVVLYLCVRVYQAMTKSGHIFVC
jgi:hypothetical protein